MVNTRVIGKNGSELPNSYACPTNVERNAISAASFEKHVMETHPSINNELMPPDHTIIIEAGIQSSISKKTTQKIDNVLHHRMLTSCGDANAKDGKSKKIDPALCVYVGAYLICVVDYKYLIEKVP